MEESAENKSRKHSRFRHVLDLFKQTFAEWSDDKAPRLGAALAYYTVFSIAPLLLIAILIAGLVFDNAEAQITAQVQGLIGDQGADAIKSMIEAANKPMQSAVATVLALGTLLFGAAGVFIQLKDALNTIWEVPQKKGGGVWAFLRKYFLSFTMVLGVGFLLLVTLIIEAGLAIVGEMLKSRFDGMDVILQTVGIVFSFFVVTFVFAMLFKFLPDVKVSWKDVWIGALLTAGLFVTGKVGLGLYLGKAGAASAYGAAGSLALVLLWVYYSAQILFFGAEFTQVYSQHHGSRSTRSLARKRAGNRKQQLIERMEEERKKFNVMVKTFDLVETDKLKQSKPRFKL